MWDEGGVVVLSQQEAVSKMVVKQILPLTSLLVPLKIVPSIVRVTIYDLPTTCIVTNVGNIIMSILL